jgi:hypothetical protein
LKFSVVMEATGSLPIRLGDGGFWIVKLPSAHYTFVSANEHAIPKTVDHFIGWLSLAVALTASNA